MAETKKPKKQYKRSVRNILIHKPMQREFTLILIALLMVSSLAIGFVIHDTIREAAFGGGFRFGKINPYEVLAEVRYQLILKVTCILFVTLVICGIFAIFFLHRVAGPIYRFRQTFLRLNDGEIPNKIHLREGDFFSEIAHEINRHLMKLAAENDKLGEARLKLKSVSDSVSDEATKASLKRVMDLISKDN